MAASKTNAANTAPPLASTGIQQRIDAERARLLVEQNLETELTTQRVAPLEAGDDEALDRIEAQINACRDRQFRIQERVELLNGRLEAAAKEDEARATEFRLKVAKEIEKLVAPAVHEYEVLAQKTAAALAHLAAVDSAVSKLANELYERGHYNVVKGSWAALYRPQEITPARTVKVKKKVPSQNQGPRVTQDGVPIFGVQFKEIEVEEVVQETRTKEYREPPVHAIAVLPRTSLESRGFWSPGESADGDAVRKLIADAEHAVSRSG